MKKLKEKGIGGIVGLGIYILIGGIIGFEIGFNTFFLEDCGTAALIAISLLYGFASMTLQTIIHEGGHLVLGLLSGYKFLSFRIFSNIWVEHDGKIVRKKYIIPGTAGQCLMWPPEYNDGKFAYLLYNLGGGLMNIIVSTLILILAELIPSRGLLYIGLIFFVYFGYAMAALNLIPMRMNGLANDGKNVCQLRKYPATRNSFYRQLFINAALTSGIRYSELDPSLYDITNLEINDMADAYVYAVYADVLTERGEIQKALEIIDMLIDHPVVKASSSVAGLNRELAFQMMLLGYDKQKVEEIVTADVLKYVKMTKIQPGTNRFEYAYELYINEDVASALKKEEEFQKNIDNSPNLGANMLEKELFLSFKEKYFAKYSESDYNRS